MVLGFGLTVAGIGMGIVFTELILLVAVIFLISIASKMIEGKKNSAPAVVVQKEEKLPGAEAEEKKEAEEDEVIAVIAAAVAACFQGQATIRSITHIAGASAPAWSHAGRQETMALRQL